MAQENGHVTIERYFRKWELAIKALRIKAML